MCTIHTDGSMGCINFAGEAALSVHDTIEQEPFASESWNMCRIASCYQH